MSGKKSKSLFNCMCMCLLFICVCIALRRVFCCRCGNFNRLNRHSTDVAAADYFIHTLIYIQYIFHFFKPMLRSYLFVSCLSFAYVYECVHVRIWNGNDCGETARLTAGCSTWRLINVYSPARFWKEESVGIRTWK